MINSTILSNETAQDGCKPSIALATDPKGPTQTQEWISYLLFLSSYPLERLLLGLDLSTIEQSKLSSPKKGNAQRENLIASAATKRLSCHPMDCPEKSTCGNVNTTLTTGFLTIRHLANHRSSWWKWFASAMNDLAHAWAMNPKLHIFSVPGKLEACMPTPAT